MPSLESLRVLDVRGLKLASSDLVLGTLPNLETLKIRMPPEGYKDSLIRLFHRLDDRPQGGLIDLHFVLSVRIAAELHRAYTADAVGLG